MARTTLSCKLHHVRFLEEETRHYCVRCTHQETMPRAIETIARGGRSLPSQGILLSSYIHLFSSSSRLWKSVGMVIVVVVVVVVIMYHHPLRYSLGRL